MWLKSLIGWLMRPCPRSGWAWFNQVKGFKSRTEVFQKRRNSACGGQLQFLPESSSLLFLTSYPMDLGPASLAPRKPIPCNKPLKYVSSAGSVSLIESWLINLRIKFFCFSLNLVLVTYHQVTGPHFNYRVETVPIILPVKTSQHGDQLSLSLH